MTTLNQITSVTTSTQEETMSSTQIANILGQEKKHVHVKIKEMFPDEIASREIRPVNSRYGGVEEYHLNELHSTMFVGRWHTPFLKQLAEFWLKRKDIKKALESKNAQPQPVEIDYDRLAGIISKVVAETVISTLNSVGALQDMTPKRKVKEAQEQAVSAENAFNFLHTRLVEFVAKSSNKIIYRTALAQKLGGKKYQASLLAVAGRASLVEAVDLIVSRSDVLKKSGKKVYI